MSISRDWMGGHSLPSADNTTTHEEVSTMALRRFDNKVVLLTGSAAGIGRATALRIAAEGGTLILADRNLAGAQQVAATIARDFGGRADAIAYDAADVTSSRRMIDNALAFHNRLDCLINNAGIYRRNHFAETTGEDWSLVLAVNLTSIYHIIHQALPALTASRGNVVSTASTAGLEGIAYAAAYAASKAGVIALTKSLATEYAPAGIRFNAVCPGRVRTDLGIGLAPVENQNPQIAVRPSKLLGKTETGEPEDLAGAFAYLASDDACYVSGSVLVVDGAQTVG
ncbi:SDR family oxidoreductase [Bradyrhizobium sp. U87765 SZCCT0131]|uniref:SDR family NAD(P)-dependent oxidoreductase n=1 Tax=unclassified Bradyrhizobium TaxID=2631580 RepID=UPI001BA5C5F7|nr:MULTISPECIES: SDR family NAD(P)-dependent oxidoreductase [unclassified Bradyrhizobium]MBR1218019.1 SDR family oxidoreductase [Bradyrhizobium sp. U87765 SZCCT0131]MBR1261035.1 SDR family oxidoreductase [Bradyrhizobium sp. U87765 SZCCT0134]MBR1303517.1 SDR family oxidoreductase [Bradyrhizobium sp. U87765 SZCCT0110]MBR1319123.1 SDR family oxidoreductase [Bradyrhizobium sp. U87765 SZCCT0109]MBR1347448.1 SDR family oxidoreductase [Bradyrhizobium sp. U87765 SZCCT0048]